MTPRQLLSIALVVAWALIRGAPAQALSPTFTYQGQLLQSDGTPVGTLSSANCAFQFTLFDAASGGNQIGTTQTISGVAVLAGRFSVQLNGNGEFGPTAFTGADRWLQPAVNCAGDSDFTVFARVQVTAEPYALYAAAAGTAMPGNDSVGSAQIQDGSVMPGDVGFNYANSMSKGGPATDLACSNCVTGAEIASGQVVKSLNALTDNVTLGVTAPLTIAPSGNTITLGLSSGGLLSTVSHDLTLTGNGSAGSPLGISIPLGLGTTTPSTPLQVVGRISTGQSGSTSGALTLYPPDGWAWFHIDNGPANRPIGRLRFSIGASPGSGAELMSILQNGNVGIGTTTPAHRLSIQGSDDANGFGVEPGTSPNAAVLRFGDNTGWKLHIGRSREAATTLNPPLNTGTTGVLMTIQDNGSVGIGTTSPTQTLDVNGSVRVRNLAAIDFPSVCVDSGGTLILCPVIFSAPLPVDRAMDAKITRLEQEVQELKRRNARLEGQLVEVLTQLRATQVRIATPAQKLPKP